jgi:hypothetical protein
MAIATDDALGEAWKKPVPLWFDKPLKIILNSMNSNLIRESFILATL